MNEVKLGQLAPENAGRDAVHVAVVPAVAGERLRPGEQVGFVGDTLVAVDKGAVGIVDPFLTKHVNKGQRFYLCLYPGTVTSLRHAWNHPSFPAEQALPSFADVIRGERGEKAQSELWLRQYAQRMNPYDGPDKAYENLMDGLRSGALTAHGTEVWQWSDLDDADELQRHAEIVLGRTVNLRAFTFSCSC